MARISGSRVQDMLSHKTLRRRNQYFERQKGARLRDS